MLSKCEQMVDTTVFENHIIFWGYHERFSVVVKNEKSNGSQMHE